jgi:hypothetical protein
MTPPSAVLLILIFGVTLATILFVWSSENHEY